MNSLNCLVENLGYEITGNPSVEIKGISYDSRKVKAGDMFFCLKGQHTDGKYFVQDAIFRGAQVIVCNRKIDIPEGIVAVIVPDVGHSLAVLSSRFYGNPSSKLRVIGVTGTNGKTTVTYLIESIFSAADIKASVIGTINYRFGQEIFKAPNTTPQSSDIQHLLRVAVDKGFNTAVIEASSHGLELGRTELTEFDAAIFTNLTRDHMDFHKTYERYFNAKEKLFESLLGQREKRGKKFAIINADDHWGKKLIKKYSGGPVNMVTFSINNPADTRARNISISKEGITFTADNLQLVTPLLGKHNVYNALASVAAAKCFDINTSAIQKGIKNLKFVPGRFERIDCGQPFMVIIDYAHTDDALKNTLNTLKDLKPKRIITVFGCGGDRDRSKRPLMGTIASEMSDYVIITEDNPRSEDPGKIALDIEVGIRRLNRSNYEIILDRAKAIEKAINIVSSGDAILIAGKGHENYQIIGDKNLPFSDTEVAMEILKCKANNK